MKFKASLLTECTLGILIIGLLLSVSTFFFKTINYEKNQFITNQRKHNIKVALEGYVMRYGFLPNASTDQKGESTKNCLIGYIPYKTLGLSKSHLKDCNGHFFQFIVNENLTLEYHLKNNKQIIPIFMPTTYVYNNNMVSWHRLYKFSEPYIIFDYDEINETKNINLYKNNQKIELDSLKCNRPILPELLYEPNSEKDMLNEFYKSKYIVKDLVAWVIITNAKTKSLDLELSNDVFFQTRFNLAASLKHPTDINSTYLSYIDHLVFQLKL